MITQGTMVTLVTTILVVGVSPARAQHPMPKPAPEMAALRTRRELDVRGPCSRRTHGAGREDRRAR